MYPSDRTRFCSRFLVSGDRGTAGERNGEAEGEGVKIKDAYEKIIAEYLSKINCCDECFASYYCIENELRTSREPKCQCLDNIKKCLKNTRLLMTNLQTMR